MAPSQDQSGHWQGMRTFVVDGKDKESETVTSFFLVPEDGQLLATFKPGQFLSFQLDIPGHDKPVLRTYTISSCPSAAHLEEGAHYRLSIKREPSPKDNPEVPPGLSSNFFHDHVEVGSTLQVGAPTGDFYLHEDRIGPVVLLSGGVGLTPMISMLDHLVGQHRRRPTWFIHGVQDGNEHAFGQHLRELAQAPDPVTAHVVYAEPRPDDVEGRDYDATGFITMSMLKNLLPGPSCDFYLCGPPPFMKALFNGLLNWGVNEARIHYEFFGPATVLKDGGDEPAQKAPKESPAANGMTVTFRKSDVTIPWDPAQETILDLAEANGLSPAFSCRSGICQTCILTLIEGEIEYVDDGIIPPQEEGKVLICSSAPKTNVVIDA
ncbi:MAG TPA: 2Fe-2S iron-sulfur cluster binding domain-containing protein [Rhodospirillales bacterium]|nr:MAG: Flavohemoprotein [Alphaproteobacteria bacterium MarineAlpha3_Bin2]HIM26122.1 2Fe-2S iron-sulfur cluster binding domain-containing protein [Rhodospirillales bacterium]HIM76468.1 2Fe-2S iron-sulfur cluster binding domain-containing protein [Rhodospirillales bacterium]